MLVSGSKANLSSKRLLAESFGRAADHYDEFAHLQRLIGSNLLERLTRARVQEGSDHRQLINLVDLGCGTGFFLEPLMKAIEPSALVAADLSLDMLKVAQNRHGELADNQKLDSLQFLACDAESLPFRANSCDVIFSSLAIQWCENLQSLWGEVHRCLKPGGMFAFSTLLDGSLSELKDAWRHVDSEQHVNNFLSCDEYLESMVPSGLEIMLSEQEGVRLEYEKVFDLMRDLKGVGAHNISTARPKAMTGKHKIMQVVESYERFRNPCGILPATYVAGYFIVQKTR